MNALKVNILTMFPANASVPLQKIVVLTNTGTPELVVASTNTAIAQLAGTSTLIHKNVNALNNHAQLVITGTIPLANASATLTQIATMDIGLTRQHALAVVSTQHQQKVSTLTW